MGRAIFDWHFDAEGDLYGCRGLGGGRGDRSCCESLGGVRRHRRCWRGFLAINLALVLAGQAGSEALCPKELE